MDRRSHLAGVHSLSEQPFGAALFADISGFTSITEHLSRSLGPKRGAEELTGLLDEVFGPVTSIVHLHGGSVIAFGGDSVTCWFEGDDGKIATHTGLELARFVSQFRSDSNSRAVRDLDIKVAIASGSARRFQVGNNEQALMDVLAGEVIENLSIESAELNAGEVAVTEKVVEALGSAAKIRVVHEGDRLRYLVELYQLDEQSNGEVSVTSVDREVAKDWLLPAVYEHLEQGLDGLMAELRPVVTMFIGIGGIDFVNDDDSGAALDGYVSWAQNVIAQYEGVMLQVMIDDKGSHLYAVFGASISHEDEERRAVVAALDLIEPPEDIASAENIRIGIAGGVAYIGAYGGRNRMTYGAHGPSVSVAARVMQAAPPGTVRVTEGIASAAGEKTTFREIGPSQFKGVDKPIVIHQAVSGSKNAPGGHRLRDEGSLVGREEERGVMAEALASLHAGNSGVILIEGRAGIGKSRLLIDFVERAELMGTTVVTTAADEIEQATAFYAWRGLMRELFGDGSESEQRLLEFIAQDPWKAQRIGLLAPLIAGEVEETELTMGMEPELRGENTQRLLTAIVHDAPRERSPLVIVFDDGHWLDSASWAMVERLAKEIPSLLLIVASRPFNGGSERSAPAEYEHLLEAENTTQVTLHELAPEDVLLLVEHSLGVKSLPGPAAELILDQAEGHPYFSQEIAFALRDAGLLIIQDGDSRLAPNVHDLSEVDFPNTVQDVITGRIDRLTARQQSILKVASVIGRDFDVPTVTHAYPGEISSGDVVKILKDLIDLDLIQDVPMDSERYRFRHAITRDIAYGLLLFAQKREMHRAVTVYLESEHADNLQSIVATLAYHSRNSLTAESDPVEVDRTLHYLGAAGRKSLRNFAHREAIGFLSDAVDLADPKTGSDDLPRVNPTTPIPNRERAKWEQDLAEAHLGMGRVDQSADHFEKALELHGSPVGHGKVGVGIKLLAAGALQTRHRLTRSNLATDRLEEREDLIEAATAYERLMKIYYYANDPGALVTSAVTGLNLAEKAGTSPVLARIYANMSIVAGIVPLHGLARTYAKRSREVADEVDRMPEHAWVRLATSVYGVGVGDWAHTEQDLRDSYDLYKRLGDLRQMEENLGTTGQMFTAQGRFEEVHSVGTELRASGAARDDPQGELWGWLYQGTSLLRRGSYRDAIDSFRNGEPLLHAGIGAVNVGWIFGLMAETYWRLGDHDRAKASAASASAALYAERPGVVFALDGFTGIAEVHLGQWATGRAREADAAKDASELAVKKLTAYSKVFPIGRPAAHRYAGRVRAQSGNEGAARKQWEAGLADAEQLRMPFEEGLLRLNLGRLEPMNRAHIDRALELFEACGATGFAEETEALLRSL